MSHFQRAKDIKVGTIGYGGAFNMGKAHLSQMQEAGMIPTAVTELDAERLKVASADFPGIQTYASVEEMLKKSDVNLIAILTPHNSHAKLAVQCLKAGRHVVCEKPFAITTAECDAMINAAKKKRLLVTAYHNRHWDGCIMNAVNQICDKGVIGDVYRIEAHMGGFGKPGDWWRSSKSISGGILYDWGVHLLEYSLQIIRSEIVEVMGFAKNGHWAPQTPWKKDTNEDEGFAIVRFKNGAWLTLNMSSLDANRKPGQLEITGTKGTYIFEGRSWTLIQPKASGEKVTTTGPEGPSEGWRFYQNIADYLVKGKDLVITGEWSRRPIHILDLACQSAKKGRALLAKYK